MPRVASSKTYPWFIHVHIGALSRFACLLACLLPCGGVARGMQNVCHSCGQIMGEQVLGLLQGKLHEAKARAEHKINIKDELELLEVCTSYVHKCVDYTST